MLISRHSLIFDEQTKPAGNARKTNTALLPTIQQEDRLLPVVAIE